MRRREFLQHDLREQQKAIPPDHCYVAPFVPVAVKVEETRKRAVTSAKSSSSELESEPEATAETEVAIST